MPLNHFFIEPKSISGNKVFISDQNQIHQIRKVLRFKIGDQIVVLDNSGYQYFAILEKITPEEIEAHIFKKEKNKNEPKLKITLCQSLLKHDKFEQVLKFGTSLGLASFIPIVTERSIVREISQNKLIRYQKIIKEAAEQSGRGVLPKIENLMTFKEAINFLKNKKALKLIGWEEERKIKVSFLKNKVKKAKEIYICIGPEGGLTSEEVLLAKKNGFIPFSLGRLILRAEIAGIVTTALLLNC